MALPPFPPIVESITLYSIPTNYNPPIRPRYTAENGFIVSPYNALRSLANQIKAHRWKGVFSSDGRLGPFANGTSAARDRWRRYFRTGPFTDSIKVLFVQAKQNEGSKTPPWGGENARGIYTLFDGVGTATYHYGASNNEPAGTPNESGVGRFTITGLSPNTEYHGLFQDAGYGVIAAGMVYELPSLDVYLDALSPGAPITQARREALVDFVNAAFRNWGAQLYNKSQDLQGTATPFGSTSAINLWNASTTGFAATDPGAERWISPAREETRWERCR